MASALARLAGALPLLGFVTACGGDTPGLPEPGSYQLHPALEMRLWAAEPDVVDPVALAFDAAERMYVVEMRDYPEGLRLDGRAGGTIRLLEDIDRDGRADRSTVFAEGLSFPTSIAAWRGGVFVTAPPQILYLEDRDGDRRADVREVVYEGFELGVTDSNVNGLRWSLDNRIHGVNGGNGGNVRPVAAGGPATDLQGLDFRFDPRTRAFETTFHTAAGFGLVFDPWGRSFSTYNVDHLQQRFIEARYLSRAGALPPLRATGNVSVHGAMARIFPISAPVTRPNHPEQAGYFSSAGGIGWLDFEDAASPYGLLVCDVVGNLVSREVARLEGPVFVTERAPEERDHEFFASRDPAFRPVAVEMGPDGALYLLDMQRDTIEHPDYIPESRLSTVDPRAGSDRGRIYRIVPRQGLPAPRPSLAEASPRELVAELASPSRWRRDTAQRLLIERGTAPLEELRRMATTGESALGRVHALWTLEGLSAASEELVTAALDDADPGVRENAVRIAEAHLPGSGALRARLVAKASDPSARVRFQAALTLGQLAKEERGPALASILRRDAGHHWSRVAVESSLGGGADAATVLAEVLRESATLPEAESLALELADLAGAGFGRDDGPALEALLRAAQEPGLPPSLAGAVMQGLESGLTRAEERPRGTPSMAALLDRAMAGESLGEARAAWRVRRAVGLADGDAQSRLLAGAMRRAADASLSIEQRAEAVDLLALGRRDDVAAALLDRLAANEPSELQARAVGALAGFPAPYPALGSYLVGRFRGLGPAARAAAIALLLRRSELHGELVSAIESGRLTTGELHLDLEQRRRLLRSQAPGVAARAGLVLDDDDYGGRAAVIEAWLARLPAEGSPERGRGIFERLCAQCHMAGGAGHAVGPDLASLRHHSVEDLVSNILDPDLGIHPGYVAYEAELRSGERLIGLIEAESSAAITMLQAGGVRRTLARGEMSGLASTGHSLMPAGLEQGLDPLELRDLVALIQGGLSPAAD